MKVNSRLRFLLLISLTLAKTCPLHGGWLQTNGPYGGQISAFLIRGTNLFAGTSNGLFLSTNSGTSWTETGLIHTYIRSLAMNGANILAGTYAGVLVSTDNGSSWQPHNSGLTNLTINAFALCGNWLFEVPTTVYSFQLIADKPGRQRVPV